MGRRIFENLKKAIAFIFSVHFPIAGMSLIPVVLKWPLALLPVHILFLELIIDPACTVVFEMENDEPDIMRRRPRRLEEPLFGRRMVLSGLIQGLGVLAAILAVYAIALLHGHGEDEARMSAFVCLVTANLGLIFTNRSMERSILGILRIPNRALWWITGGALGFLVLVTSIPLLREVFRFEPIHRGEMGLIFLAAFASLLISESVKFRFLRRWIVGGRQSKKMS